MSRPSQCEWCTIPGCTKWTDTITEDQARELGSALIGWAGRKRIARRAVGA